MSVIKEGEIGLRQDLLIYGKDYHLWRSALSRSEYMKQVFRYYN